MLRRRWAPPQLFELTALGAALKLRALEIPLSFSALHELFLHAMEKNQLEQGKWCLALGNNSTTFRSVRWVPVTSGLINAQPNYQPRKVG